MSLLRRCIFCCCTAPDSEHYALAREHKHKMDLDDAFAIDSDGYDSDDDITFKPPPDDAQLRLRPRADTGVHSSPEP